MITDASWVLTCAALVFLMQAGFLCLESGLTRSRNSINVAMKNIADISLAIILYWLIGYSLMYGPSIGGLVGNLAAPLEHTSSDISFFIFQAMFCGTAVTILSGAIAERVRFPVYIIITVVIVCFIYPIVGHWVWNEDGWIRQTGFSDFAGSTVVHSIGGWCALSMLFIIGARKNRFDYKGNLSPIYHSNLPQAMLGVLILWFGWLGFNGGSTLGFNDTVPLIILNTMLAGGSGLVASLFIERLVLNHYSARSALNGVLSGLVAITASCNVIEPMSAVIIGSISACVTFGLELLLIRFRIDDAVSAIPVHLGGGIWGSLALPIFTFENPENSSLLSSLFVQFSGIVSVGAFCLITTYIVFRLINAIYPLRVDKHSEEIGLNVSEHSQANEVYELIKVMEEQGKRNDLSIRASVNEFSDTGLIARYYNETMNNLEDTNQELVLSKLKYEAISKNSPIGIISVDPYGCCLFANAAINETMGLDAELLNGLNPSNYSGSDPSLLVLKEWIRLLLGKKEATGEYEFKNRNGDIKSVYLQVGLELTPDNSVKGYILTINDITERLQLERQLKQAQKMESVGKMAAGIAHEINSPLQFISSNVDFIKDSFSNLIAMQKVYTDLLCKIDSSADIPADNDDLDFIMEEVPNAIDQTLEGVDRVSNIIKFMKNLEQPCSQVFSKQNLNRTIENSVVATRHEWKNSANLKLELDQSLPETPCIEAEISQALMILVVNASQAIQEASPMSKGMIKISSRFDDDNVTLCVMDNGPGIPDRIIDKIFDPFFTTKSVGMGTGQGLSVAYKIIHNQHRGRITVKSKEGVGTQFRITLPRVRADTEDSDFIQSRPMMAP